LFSVDPHELIDLLEVIRYGLVVLIGNNKLQIRKIGMGLLKVVVTRVADVENVRDSERRDHLTILGVLPLAQVDFPREHLVAELLGDLRLW